MGEARMFQKVTKIKQEIQSFQNDLKSTGNNIGSETESQLQQRLQLQQQLESLDIK